VQAIQAQLKLLSRIWIRLPLACFENNLTHFRFLWNGEDHEMPIWNANNIVEDGYARDFVEFVEHNLKLPVTYLGTGRDRNQLIQRMT
jgi:hypothetical protein